MRCSCVFMLLASSVLMALPKGLEIAQGDACALQHENELRIHAADGAILHWQEFSIASPERVQFIQPSLTSRVLNRVQGEFPSEIMGDLSANGSIYLINPHGVIFGKEATVSVASLLVSTLDCSDNSFVLNEDLLFQGNSGSPIIHYGTIRAMDGDIALLGRVIENHGSLSALGGNVSIVAGQEILLRPGENSILTIRPGQNPEGTLTHTGTIEALKADLQAEGQAYSYGINLEGLVLAVHPVEEGGKIFLKSEGVSIRPTGHLHAPQGNIAIATGKKGLYNEGSIVAEGGTLQIHQDPLGSPSFQMGTLDVSGSEGGNVVIDAAKWIGHGKILAEGSEGNGGSISIRAEGSYIETVQGNLSVDGAELGGNVSIHSNTSLFSSGKFSGKGGRGGEISLEAPIMNLVSADFDASGNKGGGSIRIGGTPDVQQIHLGGDTHLSVNATEQGDGGQIIILSEVQTVCYGTIEAQGGLWGGNGGRIEISGKEGLGCYAVCNAGASVGTNGSILLDPKNIVIDATTGVYPQYTLIDPSASATGTTISVAALSTGNVVVAKPNDNTAASTAGAVYLYNGLTAALISTVLGSTAADQIGSGGITTLTGNGNYVFRSPNWDNGAVTNAGAVTWGSGTTGVTGFVSSTNSLVGTTASDQVGSSGIAALTNGNYVVRSANWDNGAVTNAGAATWGNGSTGITGVVSSSNSLVGTTASDQVSSTGVTALTNGNYVVISHLWDNGVATNAGAATWGNGSTGITGAVSSSNSLVGTTSTDQVGQFGAIALTNGNYAVISHLWDNGAIINAGAVTWGNGNTGITGAVSTSNSLYGTTASDAVGASGVVALPNGNYVAATAFWTNGGASDAGAVTWCNGTTGTTGAVSTSNSLVGTQSQDRVSFTGISTLTNGNYVVISNRWINGVVSDAGAVTWCNGTTGTTGTVSTSNSLYGTTASDQVGSGGVAALTNGNYVVVSTLWNNGAISDAGAVTWGNGITGTTGAVNSSNSLVGTTASDQIGSSGVISLTNGNYVVNSPLWDNGAVVNAGAVTWGNGTAGITGAVSSSNSLVGTTGSDQVGSPGIIPLTNGNYVVRSQNWDNGAIVNAGAVTWGNGTTGITGAVSTSNSLNGTTASDLVGGTGVIALANGNYVVLSANWDNGGTVNAGAATWGDGTTGIVGTITAQNSIIGTIASSSLQSSAADDTVNGTFIVRFAGGSGLAQVGLQNPSQMSFARAQDQTMTIQPSFITDTLNTGTSVVLQANNDFTLSSPLTSTSTGGLTIQAGRSVAINANITLANAPLTVIANDLLASGVVDAYRDPGNAALDVASGVTIDTGTGNLSLSLLNGAGKTNSGSGNVEIGNSAVLQCSGTGEITILADVNDVVLNTGVLVQTNTGNVNITAGESLVIGDSVALQPTGVGGQVILDTANVSY